MSSAVLILLEKWEGSEESFITLFGIFSLLIVILMLIQGQFTNVVNIWILTMASLILCLFIITQIAKSRWEVKRYNKFLKTGFSLLMILVVVALVGVVFALYLDFKYFPKPGCTYK